MTPPSKSSLTAKKEGSYAALKCHLPEKLFTLELGSSIPGIVAMLSQVVGIEGGGDWRGGGSRDSERGIKRVSKGFAVKKRERNPVLTHLTLTYHAPQLRPIE